MDHPTFGNGKICYLEIPAFDVTVSSDFYKHVFGWRIRNDNTGHLSFDYGVGEVSGTWVVGPTPATETGIAISIMVDNMQATIALVIKHGGKIIQPFDEDASQKFARFTDPFGNIFGLYQHTPNG